MSCEGSSSDPPQSWKPIGVMPIEMGEDVAPVSIPRNSLPTPWAVPTVSEGRLRTVFPHSSTGQKVIGQAKGRHHERGNICEETSVLWCWFRNFRNTVAPFPVKVLKLAHQ